MSQLGTGTLLFYPGGGTENEPSKYYGRTVASAALRNDEDQESFWRSLSDVHKEDEE